jgi:hypothetical protein
MGNRLQRETRTVCVCLGWGGVSDPFIYFKTEVLPKEDLNPLNHFPLPA